MSYRSLLNAAYATLAFNKEEDEIKQLDHELESHPLKTRRPGAGASRGLSALLGAMKLPQVGMPGETPSPV